MTNKETYRALSMPEQCAMQDENRKLATALQRIARGRSDCGKPLAGAAAREVARAALIGTGNDFAAARRAD